MIDYSFEASSKGHTKVSVKRISPLCVFGIQINAEAKTPQLFSKIVYDYRK